MKQDQDGYNDKKMDGKIQDERETLLSYVDTDIEKPTRGTQFGVLLPDEKDDYLVDVRYVSPKPDDELL